MKKLLLALGIALSLGVGFADNTPNPPKPATQPQKGTFPIIMRLGKHPPKKYAPSIGMTLMLTVTETGLQFNSPFSSEEYPLAVELEQLSEPYGFWTASFADPSSCELEFEVTTGDYRISITAPESMEYISYFTLE